MEALINGITLWLALTSGLPSAPEYPQIRHLPAEQFARIVPGAVVANGGEHTLLGLYDAHTKTIVLRDDWDSRNPSRCFGLVHELVHYLQDRASLSYECAGQREALAYDAQQRWLKLFGLDLQSAFQLDPLTLKVRTHAFPTKRPVAGSKMLARTTAPLGKMKGRRDD